MDLIDETDHAILVLTKLVLGIDEDQTMLRGDLLSEREQIQRSFGADLKETKVVAGEVEN